MTDPDQIRAEIERSRMELSSDVDALADKVSPGNIAHRQAEKARGAAASVLDRVMGAPSAVATGASTSVRDAAWTVGDKAADAGAAVRQQAQGNPLAVGLVAFGVGLLVASLLPASTREQEMARTIKEKAAPLAQDLGEAAKEAAANLKEPAQQAVESVKSTATDAVETVKQEGAEATHDVTQHAADAAQQVRTQQN
jgi:gas vesicle protein